MGIRLTLAVVGMFIGIGIVGLAWNDNLGKAYDVITGSSSNTTFNAPPRLQNQSATQTSNLAPLSVFHSAANLPSLAGF